VQARRSPAAATDDDDDRFVFVVGGLSCEPVARKPDQASQSKISSKAVLYPNTWILVRAPISKTADDHSLSLSLLINLSVTTRIFLIFNIQSPDHDSVCLPFGVDRPNKRP
jgi:hypothetical protein